MTFFQSCCRASPLTFDACGCHFRRHGGAEPRELGDRALTLFKALRSEVSRVGHDSATHYHRELDPEATAALVSRLHARLHWGSRKPEYLGFRPARSAAPSVYDIVLSSGKQAAGRTGRSDFRARRAERMTVDCDVCRVVLGQIISRASTFSVTLARAEANARVGNRRRKRVLCVTCMEECTDGVCGSGCPDALSDDLRLQGILDAARGTAALPAERAVANGGALSVSATGEAVCDWEAYALAVRSGAVGAVSEAAGFDAWRGEMTTI